MPKKHRLETPAAEAEPPVPEIPATPTESAAEQEPLRESADTVRQLLDAWYQEYHADETSRARKAELAYRMIRMEMACQAANLSQDEVKIREAEPGVLGFFVPSTGEIAITTGGLALPAEHYKDVLKHESTHAGKMHINRIADEGLTQLHVESLDASGLSGVYPQEKKDAQAGFEKIGIKRVLNLYDFDNPQELIDYWLEVEWDDEWKRKWRAELSDEPDIYTEAGRKKLIAGSMEEWLEKLEENFKAAAPRLLTKAKEQGFDFAKAHEREFARVLGQEEERR